MPSSTRPAWHAAATELAERHEVMAGLLERHGPPRLRAPRPGGRFEALASSICHQQLAGRAAATIWGRVRETVGEPFTPEGVLDVGEAGLRAAGCSRAKALAILDLAARVERGEVRLERIGRLADAEVVEHLTVVRGIGPWTAHMFLLFDLRRLDVWPTTDYGVRAGFARAFDLPTMPTERGLSELGAPFAPYRSVVAWWCWREADSAAG